MVLVFLSVFICAISNTSICSEISKDFSIYSKLPSDLATFIQNIDNKYMQKQSMIDVLPLHLLNMNQKITLVCFNTKITLDAYRAWKDVGCVMGEEQEESIAIALSHLKKRFEIAWDVKYKEQLGSCSIEQYYQLIQDAAYTFPKECFIQEGQCILNEKVLFSYIDHVVDQSIQKFKQLVKSKASNILHAQLVQAVEKAVTYAQTSAPAAICSAAILPTWAKNDYAKILKLKNNFLEPMYNKFAENIEQIVEQNVIPQVDISIVNIVNLKKSFLIQAYNTILLILTTYWEQTYKAKMGEQNQVKYYELLQYCWDDYPEKIFGIIVEKEGNQTKAQIIFLPQAAEFIENKIAKVVHTYIEEQKKVKAEQQARELSEQDKKQRLMHLEKIRKQKQELSNRFDRCKQFLEQLEFQQKKDVLTLFLNSCDVTLSEHNDNLSQFYKNEKNQVFENSCKILQEQQHTKEIKRQQDQEKQQALIDANAQSAQRFYDAQQTLEMRKMKEYKRLFMKQYREKTKELCSLCNAQRSAIEREEESKIKNIYSMMQGEWKVAMLAALKRSFETVKFLKRKELDLVRNNTDLAKRLQESDATILRYAQEKNELSSQKDEQSQKNVELTDQLQKHEMQHLLELAHKNEIIQHLQELITARVFAHRNSQLTPPTYPTVAQSTPVQGDFPPPAYSAVAPVEHGNSTPQGTQQGTFVGTFVFSSAIEVTPLRIPKPRRAGLSSLADAFLNYPTQA
ncbi:MAG TPA: hypothetical protein VLG50_04290 [Candidatus Saccharimonadales bacterium]|nr:hypothetical protein [Candidatus Saccharimonadales bacterium]